MESILQWGLDFIRAVQTIANPGLTAVMRIITAIGGELSYLALLSVLFWCVNEKKGLRIGFAVLISAWINMSLKFLLDQPRPFFINYDPSVGMIGEKMGGLPSGHAQNTMVMFFIIASWINRKWAYTGAVLLCLFVGFSRIYLGVHFPTDILGGWILGGLVLCGYFLFSDKIEELLKKGGLRAGMIATAVVSFIMILYLPDRNLLMPSGAIFGIGIGYCFNRRYTGFTCNAQEMTGIKKYLVFLLRLLLGFSGLLLIFTGIGKIMPQDSNNQNLYGFIHIALVGFWISFAAPWIFIKLRLAKDEIKKNA